MRPSPLATLILLALLPLAAPAAGDPAPAGPAAAIALGTAAGAALAWTSVEGAEAYVVYGITSAGRDVALDTSDRPAALVDGGYAGYSVAAVVNGAETPRTKAMLDPCIDIRDPGSVPPVVIHDCDANGGTL